MPSNKNQILVQSRQPRTGIRSDQLSSLPAKRSGKPSLTETYQVATTCRLKLGKEADRSDHELRKLVCHANMLDTLMEELVDQERAHEKRMNERLRATSRPQQRGAVRWIDTIAEEIEESEDTDSSSDRDDDSDGRNGYPRRSAMRKSPPPKLLADYFAKGQSRQEVSIHTEDNDDDLVLRRCPSKQNPTSQQASYNVSLRAFHAQCSITDNKHKTQSTGFMAPRVAAH